MSYSAEHPSVVHNAALCILGRPKPVRGVAFCDVAVHSCALQNGVHYMVLCEAA